jgi:predicted deacylase
MPEPLPAWQDVPPGTKTAWTMPVTNRADGSPIGLPVLAVRGATPGKTVLVSAGVHGDEFEGVAALHQLYAALDPASLTGTLIAVPVANPPAFEAGLRTNPDDRQDMARVFPGDPSGTVTEQLAHALAHRFIRHAGFYCDLHSAGLFYSMPPLAGYQLRPEPLLTVQRQAARSLGMAVVWGTPGLPGRSLSVAGDFGVPAIYAELTGEGRCRRGDVAMYVQGLRQLLAHLGLTQEAWQVEEPAWIIEDDRPQAGYLQVQNRAPVGGLFHSEVGLLSPVTRGQEIGTIRDSLGTARRIVRATHTGIIVFLRTFPRVLAGDPLCTILETNE